MMRGLREYCAVSLVDLYETLGALWSLIILTIHMVGLTSLVNFNVIRMVCKAP